MAAVGGIADARGITAAFALGASAVQIRYCLFALPGSQDQSPVPPSAEKQWEPNSANECIHGASRTRDRYPHGPGARPNIGVGTRFSTREWLLCSAPLRVKSEAKEATDFTPMWSGQSGRLARELPAKEITQRLAAENACETQLVMTFRRMA
jgi:nitronate monooxygenase